MQLCDFHPAIPARCRKIPLFFILLLIWMWSDAVGACTVEANGVPFGTYNPFSSAPLDGAGTITITCPSQTSYTVSLSTGNGTYAGRLMQSGTETLEYNLYTDSGRTTIWGDGSGGTSTVSGSDAGMGTSHTVYGRIPERQNPLVGGYTDTLTVTISF